MVMKTNLICKNTAVLALSVCLVNISCYYGDHLLGYRDVALRNSYRKFVLFRYYHLRLWLMASPSFSTPPQKGALCSLGLSVDTRALEVALAGLASGFS